MGGIERTTTTTTAGGTLRELDEEECWELLSTRSVGRLAWQGQSGLTVVPLNFRTAVGTIFMRTTAYSAAARECDDSPVAFQTDHIDPMTRAGWSVLVRGRAHIDVTDPHDDGIDVWAAGPRPMRLRIDVDEVTGRQLPAS